LLAFVEKVCWNLADFIRNARKLGKIVKTKKLGALKEVREIEVEDVVAQDNIRIRLPERSSAQQITK